MPKVFTVPMRNWNLFYFWSWFCFWFWFLQYLWGIETFLRYHFIYPLSKQFLQYLWGIETIQCLLIPLYAFSFYSTYEELKPPKLERIQRMWAFLQYLWGIETRNIWWYFNFYEWVFTVPMRNWNRLVLVA